MLMRYLPPVAPPLTVQRPVRFRQLAPREQPQLVPEQYKVSLAHMYEAFGLLLVKNSLS